MKWKRLTSKKGKAQAMVEFAIVLPVLLLLLYGIIETGRLLFMYSTVVTASRQAVRYGSATGIGNGTGNVNEPRYQDCDGIRAAAQKVGFVGAFNTITISHNDGPDSSDPSIPLNPQTYCTDPTAQTDVTNWTPSANNKSRISVTVEKQFTPIVKLVPFAPLLISAKSSRTILVSVSIQVTSPPITFIPSSPTYTPSPTASSTPTATNTATNTATFTPVFTPTPSITPTFTVSPTKTLTPTITLTTTQIPTNVPGCSAVSHGPISISGNTMFMTITNPYSYPLATGDGSVTWNADKGNNLGNKHLSLLSATLNGTIIWNSGPSNPNVDTLPFVIPASLPANTTVSIIFSFDGSYDSVDLTESISINLTTPGCNGFVIK
jgi:Flp pilus assembly protein TadG